MDGSHEDQWFAQDAHALTSLVPPMPPERSHVATLILGVVFGALASVAALACAGAIVAGTSWRTFAPVIGNTLGTGMEIGVAVFAGAGALLGAVLALVMRHGARWVLRAIFAASTTSALWFCAHLALVMHHRFTPPLAPMLAGTALYGVLLAFIPPSRR